MKYQEGCENCEQEKWLREQFGLFGLDLKQTKKMLNYLLEPHGLKLKVTSRRSWGDQSKVKIVRTEARV